jgi:hypothetical protein
MKKIKINENQLRKIIQNILNSKKENTKADIMSENLKYHLNKKIPISKNIFRTGSESFYNLLGEVRILYDNKKLNLEGLDKELYESTDIGRFAFFEGHKVPLDIPMLITEELNESEHKGKKVKLNKPTRSSGPKKYKVYVKNPKTGNVIQVNFGDVKGGLTSKIGNPAARKSFVARHDCKNKKDKTKPGYWSCRIPKYADSLGLSGGGNFYW